SRLGHWKTPEGRTTSVFQMTVQRFYSSSKTHSRQKDMKLTRVRPSFGHLVLLARRFHYRNFKARSTTQIFLRMDPDLLPLGVKGKKLPSGMQIPARY